MFAERKKKGKGGLVDNKKEKISLQASLRVTSD